MSQNRLAQGIFDLNLQKASSYTKAIICLLHSHEARSCLCCSVGGSCGVGRCCHSGVGWCSHNLGCVRWSSHCLVLVLHCWGSHSLVLLVLVCGSCHGLVCWCGYSLSHVCRSCDGCE